MTTITLQDNIKLQKTHFVSLVDLYEYLENYIGPDLQFTSYSNMSENHKKEYDKSLQIDKSKLVNI